MPISQETPHITLEIRKARYKAFEAFDSFSAMVVRREARTCLHSNRIPSQIPFPRHCSHPSTSSSHW